MTQPGVAEKVPRASGIGVLSASSEMLDRTEVAPVASELRLERRDQNPPSDSLSSPSEEEKNRRRRPGLLFMKPKLCLMLVFLTLPLPSRNDPGQRWLMG